MNGAKIIQMQTLRLVNFERAREKKNTLDIYLKKVWLTGIFTCYFIFRFQMVVSKVRLPLMKLDDLLKIVRPCKILGPDRLLDAIEEKTDSKNLLYRGALCKSNGILNM